MQEDGNTAPQEPQEPIENQQEPAEPQEPQEDYRGKLNATNNFLKKEGYTFNETTKQWDKPNKPSIPEAPSQDGLSNKDVLFLAKADIHEDDLDDVIDYARLKKIPVAEAHKFMKPILAERAEERRTAAATRTGSGARGASKATGDDLLRKADQSGEVPESDDGIKALVEARLARKKQK
jgi:hypothetical protein